jgi:hypothetical protein
MLQWRQTMIGREVQVPEIRQPATPAADQYHLALRCAGPVSGWNVVGGASGSTPVRSADNDISRQLAPEPSLGNSDILLPIPLLY